MFRNSLDRLMRRAARRDDALEEFYAALLEAKLWAPEPPIIVGMDPPPQRALFTSEAAAKRFARSRGGAERIIEAGAPELFARALEANHWAILNPGADLWYELHPDEMRAIAQHKLPGDASLTKSELPSGFQFVVRAPDDNPLALKQALISILQARGDVTEAYLAQVEGAQPEGITRFLLGIVLEIPDDETMQSVVRAIDPALRDKLADGQTIDVALLDEPSLLEACRKAAPPFFRRS
jgi:hypothetical protein